MVSSRVAASLAVLVGGSLGTTAALFDRPLPPPTAPSEPSIGQRSAPATGARIPVAQGVPLTMASAPAKGAGVSIDAVRESPRSEPVATQLDAAAVWELELRCARVHVRECLQAADAYEAGNGVEPDARKANIYANRARRLWDHACMRRRDPEACVRLSEIYRLGRGIRKNSQAARGFLFHARELCKSKHVPFCDQLGEADAP